MAIEENPVIAIHTLSDTSEEKLSRFVDDGRFIKDLSDLGYGLTITNKGTFDNGVLRNPVIDADGVLSFQPSTLDQENIQGMHVRVLGSVNRPGSENIPKLNTNAMKVVAGSKIELYEKVLSGYQVDTQFLPISTGTFVEMAETVHSVATKNVVLKANDGTGGSSTEIMSKKDALAWITGKLEGDRVTDYIIQPQIKFGPLPEGIRANGTEDEQSFVERSRYEGLLAELRMYVVKRHDTVDTVPILRIVREKGMPMQGSNDSYVDVTLPDDLHAALDLAARDIVDRATAASGNVEFALGAIDFYFDEFGMPHVMEANFRSPGILVTRENPIGARALRQSMAKSLVAMHQEGEV